MKTIVRILNFFKAKFKPLLIGFTLVLSFIVVQYIGQYESVFSKYGVGLAIFIPLIMGWYQLEKKLEQQVDSDHQRSLIWIALFLIAIPIGVGHIIQKEIQYEYHFPMCDCNETTDRSDRVGAICDDGTKSYSTGRGTCSEHHGVKKWQCVCD